MKTKISSNLQNVDVLILSGGLGTRLRQVISDRPKTMAPIKDQPFLSLLIGYVAKFGFRRFIISTGYMADYIENYYQKQKRPYSIVFSREKKPLGTGGAIKKAKKYIKSNQFLVINGDSFCQIDLADFFQFHLGKKGLVSMAIVKKNNRKDGGNIILDKNNKIIKFSEKSIVRNTKTYLNAGIYFFNKKIFSLFSNKNKFSLEHDLFPKLSEKRFYGFLIKKNLIDIGTPDRYFQAKNKISIFK